MASSAPSPEKLIELTTAFVERYMAPTRFDASHDYTHIVRVLEHAENILATETAAGSSGPYDRTIVILSALLHDVGDHKYTAAPPAPSTAATTSSTPAAAAATTTPAPQPAGETHTALSWLQSINCPADLAYTVQEIVTAVSYTRELRSSAQTQAVLAAHPELGIVQDADRLDSLGATAIARFFTFGGAPAGKRPLDKSMYHLIERSENVVTMMKTDTGNRLAKDKMDRLRVFQAWWLDEMKLAS